MNIYSTVLLALALPLVGMEPAQSSPSSPVGNFTPPISLSCVMAKVASLDKGTLVARRTLEAFYDGNEFEPEALGYLKDVLLYEHGARLPRDRPKKD